MSAGLPSGTKQLTSLFSRLPDSAVGFISKVYIRYLWLYTKLVTWLCHGREYDSHIDPFELYHISPDKIGYQTKNKIGTTWECSVLKGDWDTSLVEFEDANIVHTSFRQRFVHNKEWETTEIYSYAMRHISSDNSWEGCQSESEVIDQLYLYDKLYRNIKQNGYKTQRQLRKASDTDELQDKRYHPPEFAEVSVDVGRGGQLIWYGGQHRISMAKILDLDTIPVRIRIRHKKWQEYRDEVWNNSNMDASWHPDLQQPD